MLQCVQRPSDSRHHARNAGVHSYTHIQKRKANNARIQTQSNQRIMWLGFDAQHLQNFLGKDVKRSSMPNACSRNNACNVKIKRKLMFLNYHLWPHFHVPTLIAKVRPQTVFHRNMPAQTETAASRELEFPAV